MDSVVQQLHLALVQALVRRGGDVAAEPVTVAEVYQELVPYRSVRDAVGFEMNADYEHALLRLLSGEDDLVRLEPEEVRDQLRRELTMPNPDVGLFRRFAACDLWVRPAPGPVPLPAGTDLPEPEAEPPAEVAVRPVIESRSESRPVTADVEATAPTGSASADSPVAAGPSFTGAAGAAIEVVERAPDEAERAGPEAEVATEAPRVVTQCAFCRSALPEGRPIRFCPYCGVDQSLRPCARCGEVLEPGWRYCISCGAAAPVRPATA